MSKTKDDRLVIKNIKGLNQSLRQDVYGSRFWARQVLKTKQDGIGYYMYELCDRENPDRNKIIQGWLNVFDITIGKKVWIAMNDFIVDSDFWKKERDNVR